MGVATRDMSMIIYRGRELYTECVSLLVYHLLRNSSINFKAISFDENVKEDHHLLQCLDTVLPVYL